MTLLQANLIIVPGLIASAFYLATLAATGRHLRSLWHSALKLLVEVFLVFCAVFLALNLAVRVWSACRQSALPAPVTSTENLAPRAKT